MYSNRLTLRKRLKNSVLWRCSVRSSSLQCNATVRQKGEEFVRGPNKHVHGPEPCVINKTKVMVQVKEQARQHAYKSATELVNEAIREHIDPNQPDLPLPSNMARYANRFRSKFRPAQPKDLDFVLDTEFLQCNNFLVSDINIGSARHLIFATDEQLSTLASMKRWFMDGTFKVLGEPFRRGQLCTIHGFVLKNGNHKQIPLAFIIMSRRRKEDYVKVLTALKENLVNVDVENFVIDFEQAAWLAVRDVFPNVTIKGCVFHFTQAIWRKIQEIGLQATYLERGATHTYMRHLMALPFLPPEHIEPTFDHLRAKAQSSELVQLVEYIDSQWMSHPIFDIRSWSIFGILVRTNNDCEGWHNKLNSQAGYQCLSLYRLIPILRHEAELISYNKNLILEGKSHRRVRDKSVIINERLTSIWDQYLTSRCGTMELLAQCSRIYTPKVNDDENEN